MGEFWKNFVTATSKDSRQKARTHTSCESWLDNLPPPVLTKTDFVERYRQEEFGNRAPTWNSLADMEEQAILEHAPDGTLYHVRNRIAGAQTWYNIHPENLADVWYGALMLYPDSLYISEMAPHDKNLLQGEVMQSEEHLTLRYSRMVGKPMRDVLIGDQHHAGGIDAVMILRECLCGRSYAWLNYLLDVYPSHIIEFSAFSICWGTIPGFNTVFWEVRSY